MMKTRKFLIPFSLTLLIVLLLGLAGYKLSERFVPPPSGERMERERGAAAAAPPAGEPRAERSVPARPNPEGDGARPQRESAAEGGDSRPAPGRADARDDRKLAEALAAGEDGEFARTIDSLAEKGRLSRDEAERLRKWKTKGEDSVTVTPIGVTEHGGEPVRRYKLTNGDGASLLVEMKKKEDGTWMVTGMKEADASAKDDPLTLVDNFMTAVRQGDVAAARGMIIGREVSPATLAGLCMLFEEDLYALRDRDPVRSMFAGEDNAGFLVYLQSRMDGKPAHIGFELRRTGENEWGVASVSLDALLASYEQSGRLESGVYFPIVKNPGGGDSIALFFAFNESALTPRSQRQLSIIAELLKATDRRLKISGHTDDVGSEGFNYKLSLRRAAAVRDALVRGGVDPSHIDIKGMGKTQPRRSVAGAANEKLMEEARGENRRAEIYLDFSE